LLRDFVVVRVLVVDGSADNCASTCQYLRDAGYQAVCAGDAETAMSLLRTGSFAVVITEWSLPDVSGLELAAWVRRNPRSAGARILVISDRSEHADITDAFEHGIDDYVLKALCPEELVARVNAALRRPVAGEANILQVGAVVLDRDRHRVTVGEHEIDLAPAEFRLMAHFMENKGRVFGRKQLLVQVWNRHKGIGERTVDVHVRRLRAALTPHGQEKLLQTVRGFGYRFG
jgi:two-component system phosphate regulon response regulator PhoB